MAFKQLSVYRTKQGKYVNKETKKGLRLGDIFSAVRDNVEVTVLDRETSTDITKETLINALRQNFIQNKDRINLRDIQETIQTIDESYGILDEVDPKVG